MCILYIPVVYTRLYLDNGQHMFRPHIFTWVLAGLNIKSVYIIYRLISFKMFRHQSYNKDFVKNKHIACILINIIICSPIHERAIISTIFKKVFNFYHVSPAVHRVCAPSGRVVFTTFWTFPFHRPIQTRRTGTVKTSYIYLNRSFSRLDRNMSKTYVVLSFELSRLYSTTNRWWKSN